MGKIRGQLRTGVHVHQFVPARLLWDLALFLDLGEQLLALISMNHPEFGKRIRIIHLGQIRRAPRTRRN